MSIRSVFKLENLTRNLRATVKRKENRNTTGGSDVARETPSNHCANRTSAVDPKMAEALCFQWSQPRTHARRLCAGLRATSVSVSTLTDMQPKPRPLWPVRRADRES